jgi:hypothetical protein
LISISTELRAETAQIPSIRDNTLIEDPAGSLSNGAGPHVFAGRTAQFFGFVRRGLLYFDVAAHLPSGATVLSADLTLHLSQTNGPESPVALHGLLADWGEGPSYSDGGRGTSAEPGDATWIHTYYDDSFWSAPGGDLVGAPTSSIPVGAVGFYTWPSSPAMVAEVQSWLDEPSSNHGWALVGDESSPSTAKGFDSRENQEPTWRPVLVVTYETRPVLCEEADLSAKALGLCLAYCVRLDCDSETPRASEKACATLARHFEDSARGLTLPCETPQ